MFELTVTNQNQTIAFVKQFTDSAEAQTFITSTQKYWPVGSTYAVIDKRTYKDLRAPEYPPATDYLDGIVKGDQEQVQAYLDACRAVKAKYPKPTS